jgi:hypothetical protein
MQFLKRAIVKDLLAAATTGASTASLATAGSATMSHLIMFVITLSKKKKFA